MHCHIAEPCEESHMPECKFDLAFEGFTAFPDMVIGQSPQIPDALDLNTCRVDKLLEPDESERQKDKYHPRSGDIGELGDRFVSVSGNYCY